MTSQGAGRHHADLEHRGRLCHDDRRCAPVADGSYVAAYIVLAVVAVIGFILVVTLDDRCIGREDA